MTRSLLHDRRDGFTLPEVLIAVVMMGLIVGVISAAAVAILKTQPGSVARADDARTYQGLTNHLPDDVASTPPGGFVVYSPPLPSAGGESCSGVAPSGTKIVDLAWTQGVTFWAYYRFENGRVVRYSCSSSAPASTERLNMTSDAAAVTPVAITNPSSEIVGVRLEIDTPAGDRITVDASSRNPEETLP